MKNLTDYDMDQIASKYASKQACQVDLAIEYGVSRTTIRRVLAEKKLVEFEHHKTAEEKSMLELLKTFNITSSDQLRQRLTGVV